MRLPLDAAVVVVALLTGCGGNPSAEPTPPPVAAPTASPTPEAPDPELASLTVLGDGTVATDTVGNEMADIGYFDDVSSIVATLTVLFQFEPTVEVVEPVPSDRFAGTIYDWEGFSVYWYGFESEPGTGIGDPPHHPAVFFLAEVADVRGISIETQDGIRVGDSMTKLAERYPDSLETHEMQDGVITSVQVGRVPLPPLETAPELEAYFYISVVGSTDGMVNSIFAPARGNSGSDPAAE